MSYLIRPEVSSHYVTPDCSVSSPDDPIIFSGSVRGESAIKIEDEIGPPINHTFVVG